MGSATVFSNDIVVRTNSNSNKFLFNFQIDSMSVIRKLDDNVINRIAAGEVIQRPSSAVKELIENSIDAGSTMITLTIKGGGLQCIQIQDNGHGINKDDMLTVCNRFTTSKLSAYDDLKSIGTFGFRGEALASITYVSKVTITSKTAEAPCAYKAKYNDGDLLPWDTNSKAEPKLCAGLQGTTVVIEDLFYNIAIRRKSFQNTNEEYQRVLDVISRYSILYGDKGIFFVCKKHGQSIPDLVTTNSSSSKENIGRVFGNHVTKELMHVQGVSQDLNISVEGEITNASYSGKSGVYVLFINNRLIECSSIRKVIDGTYHDLFTQQVRPFVYLSIRMPPENIDVNVHPTKKEVHFLHEDELLLLIRRIIEPALNASNQSRTFGAQPSPAYYYPSDSTDSNALAVLTNSTRSTSGENGVKSSSLSTSKPTIRADGSLQKMESFFKPSKSANGDSSSSQGMIDRQTIQSQSVANHVDGCVCCSSGAYCLEVRKRKRDSSVLSESNATDGVEQIRLDLDSVRGLLRNIDLNCDAKLRSLFAGLVFVGVVDDCHSLVQLESQLMLVNHNQAIRQLSYQLILLRFSGMVPHALNPPVNVSQFMESSLETFDMSLFADNPKEAISSTAVNVILDHKDLLSDYFAIRLNERDELVSLPELFPGLIPNLNSLPFFLRDLALDTEWTNESRCIDSIAHLLAKLYTCFPVELPGSMTLHRALESVFYPLMRKHLKPDKNEPLTCFAVTDLNNLYKVFERC